MGSLAITVHWERLVFPSVRGFIQHEDLLSVVATGGDAELLRDVSYETLRNGMVGAIFLYHFAEVALERGALAGATSKADARELISNASVAANGDSRPDDHKVLGEVADAIKHAELHSATILHVPKKGRAIEISHDQPTIFSEGQPIGTPQVVIVTHAGTRSLRALFENIGRGWNAILGLPPF